MSRPLHPLIRNPVRWLKGVTKRHSESLYRNDFYDSSSIDANPFAQLLQSTRKDVSGYRFPIGNMIQVVVKKKEDNRYELAPVIEKPTKGQSPASYLINNKAYLQLLNHKQVRPVPLKYRQRSTAILSQLSLSDEFVDRVDEMYREEVEKSKWDQCFNDNNESVPGIILRPADSDNGITWDKSTPIVTSEAVSQDTCVAYNQKLSINSIKWTMYKTPIYIKGPAP